MQPEPTAPHSPSPLPLLDPSTTSTPTSQLDLDSHSQFTTQNHLQLNPSRPTNLVSTSTHDLPTSQALVHAPHDTPSTTEIGPHDTTAKRTSFASASSSSIKDWLEQTVQATSTSVSTSISTSSVFHTLKRKRDAPPEHQVYRDDSGHLPLKRRHLEKHLATFASMSVPVTPQKASNTGRTAATEPSESITTGSASSNKDPGWVKERMEQHKIFRDASALKKPEYSEFKRQVFDVVKQFRHSGRKQQSDEKFPEKYELLKDLNEQTFKIEMLRLLIKDEFQVRVKPSNEEVEVFESRDSFDNGLVAIYDQPLKRKYIPTVLPPGLDKNAFTSIMQQDGMTNPIPDGIWGFQSRQLPEPPEGTYMLADTNDAISVVPGMTWPFFLMEVKPDAGSMEVARNQACRGGATIINAARKVLEKSGRVRKDEKVGPDYDTYVYSVTMDADILEWWINWAEVRSGKQVAFHMDFIGSERFKADDALLTMRGALHNILEWGLYTRLPVVKKRYNAIFEACRQEILVKTKVPKTSKSNPPVPSIPGSKPESSRKRARVDGTPTDSSLADG